MAWHLELFHNALNVEVENWGLTNPLDNIHVRGTWKTQTRSIARLYSNSMRLWGLIGSMFEEKKWLRCHFRWNFQSPKYEKSYIFYEAKSRIILIIFWDTWIFQEIWKLTYTGHLIKFASWKSQDLLCFLLEEFCLEMKII